jgi:hypothetical protein
VRHAGGEIGQDNSGVYLGDLGLDADEFARLQAERVI